MLKKRSPASEHTSSDHKFLFLSLLNETSSKPPEGRCAKMRKSTTQSKLMVVAFSLGARCRRALSKKKAYPHIMIATPVEVILDETPSDPVQKFNRSFSPRATSQRSSLSSWLSNGSSSRRSSQSTASERSNLSSELSFCCRGVDLTWEYPSRSCELQVHH